MGGWELESGGGKGRWGQGVDAALGDGGTGVGEELGVGRGEEDTSS